MTVNYPVSSASARARFWAGHASRPLAGVRRDACALGAWQLGRAQRRSSPCRRRSRRARRCRPSTSRPSWRRAAAADLLHRPVVLRGTWLAQHTVYLDNRQMHGMPGFYVVTPLRSKAAAAAVLVQRGWVQRNFIQRDKLPPIETPPGLVELHGRIAPPPAKLYEFAGAGLGPPSGKISTWPSSGPKPVCRCWTWPCSRPASRRKACCATGRGRQRRRKALRLCLPVVGLECPDRNPLCLVPIHRPPPQGPLMLDEPLGLTVHSLPAAAGAAGARRPRARAHGPLEDAGRAAGLRRAGGRLLLHLLRGPSRGPAQLRRADRAAAAAAGARRRQRSTARRCRCRSLQGPVAAGQRGRRGLRCACEHHLYLQRQLRESLGKDKDRVGLGLAGHRRRRRSPDAVARRWHRPRCCAWTARSWPSGWLPRRASAGRSSVPGRSDGQLDDALSRRHGRVGASGQGSSATSTGCCAPPPPGTTPAADPPDHGRAAALRPRRPPCA